MTAQEHEKAVVFSSWELYQRQEEMDKQSNNIAKRNGVLFILIF